VWRVRTEPDEKIAPPGDRLRRTALGIVLTGTALLAPAYQAHLHTDISFLKHVGFGLFFAAPMAGFGLTRIIGDYFRRPQFGIGVWSLALVLGMVQSNFLYHVRPSSGAFVKTFSRYLKPHALYLVEVPVPGQRSGPSIQNPGQYPSACAGFGCLIDAVTIISPPTGAPNSWLVVTLAEVHAEPGLPDAPWPRATRSRLPCPSRWILDTAEVIRAQSDF
jgi:hypothetical protein